MRITIAALLSLAAALSLSPVSAGTLPAPDLQALVAATTPVPGKPASALGNGYSSFSQSELGACFNPSIEKDITTQMGPHYEVHYAATRDDLFRQLHMSPASRFGFGGGSASVFASAGNAKLGQFHRLLVAQVVVRGKGRRFTRSRGWIDSAPAPTARASFVGTCGDKFVREIYPTASLTVLYVFTLANEQDAVAMDLRARDKSGNVKDGADLVGLIDQIRGKADWTARAQSTGWNRTVPVTDLGKLQAFTENFSGIVNDCRATVAVTCSADAEILEQAESGSVPAGAFFTDAAVEYSDYRDEIGILDVGREWYRLSDLSDHFTKLLDLRDTGSSFFLNSGFNYWPANTGADRLRYESEVEAALLALRKAAESCAASLSECTEFDMAATDQLLEDNPFGDKYGTVAVNDVAADKQGDALGYIADGKIGLVDFLGTISAPHDAPYRDARDTNRIELRMRNSAAIVDEAQSIPYTGQTCIKGPATVLYWPVGQSQTQEYAGEHFRGRIWIIDASEEANLPKGTICYSPKQ